jgi:hypothetical protein
MGLESSSTISVSVSASASGGDNFETAAALNDIDDEL